MLTEEQKQALREGHAMMWEGLAKGVTDIRDDLQGLVDGWKDDWLFDPEKVKIFDLINSIEDLETYINRFEERIKELDGQD